MTGCSETLLSHRPKVCFCRDPYRLLEVASSRSSCSPCWEPGLENPVSLLTWGIFVQRSPTLELDRDVELSVLLTVTHLKPQVARGVSLSSLSPGVNLSPTTQPPCSSSVHRQLETGLERGKAFLHRWGAESLDVQKHSKWLSYMKLGSD